MPKRINVKCPTCGAGSVIWDTKVPFRRHRCNGNPSHHFFTNDLVPCTKAAFWSEKSAGKKQKAAGMANLCSTIGSALFPDMKQNARPQPPIVEPDPEIDTKTGHSVTKTSRGRIYTMDMTAEP